MRTYFHAFFSIFCAILMSACGGSGGNPPDSSSPSSSSSSSSAPNESSVKIHYLRVEESYTGWGLHLWGDAISTSVQTEWTAPRAFDEIENGAAVFDVPVENLEGEFNFIVHMGDVKNPVADLGIIPSEFGTEVWVVQNNNALFSSRSAADAALAAIGSLSAILDLSEVTLQNNDTGLPAGWANRTAFMEIFVRSYQDSDGDGIGDFQGLISRLDYLQNLGVRGLWLMPITESSDNDHGYAVTDYRAVESDYGTMADFEQLLAEAHQREIAIIIDYVVNHSSSQNPLFLDASSSPENDKRDWYIWQDTKPTGWSGFGGDPWHGMGDAWYYGVFTNAMPDFNLNNPEVAEYHKNSLKYWLNKGVDGFRFDAVGVLFENGRDAWEDQPENHPFMNSLKTLIESYDKRYTVCESPSGFEQFARSNSCGRAFNFASADAILESARSGKVTSSLIQVLSDAMADRMPLILGNHDAFAGGRVWNELDGNQTHYKLAAATYLLSSPTPFTYYGEEIGMAEALRLNGDAALRTPMSWTPEPSTAGFTNGTPYRDLSGNYTSQNVEELEVDPESLLNYYQSLFQLRTDYPLISTGQLSVLSKADAEVLALTREQDNQQAVILINYGTASTHLVVDTGRPATEYINIFGILGSTVSDSEGQLTITLPSQSTQVLLTRAID